MPANPYEIQRNRIRSDASAASQEQNDALKRRFAAMGGLNSGSYLKAQERLSGQQEKNVQGAMEGVDMQEALERRAMEEAQRQRDFSRSEREAGQGWQSGETALSRRFATSEREAGQGWQASQAKEARDWQTGESKLARDQQESQFSRGLADQQAARADQTYLFYEQKGFNQQQADRANDLALKQYGLDQDAQDFNKKLSAFISGTSLEDLMALGSRRADNARIAAELQGTSRPYVYNSRSQFGAGAREGRSS